MRHPDFKLLKTVFAQFPQIQAVYLFGSLASGRGRPDSDMEVDRTIVYEVLQNGLGDIEELKRVFARFL